MRWRVRRATPADLDRLADLCRASVGSDDYVLAWLPWELLHSVVHVATDARGRFAGMAVYRPVLDGSGWLAMARTHPACRRQGVQRAIADSFADLARRSGASCLRLWSNRRNEEGVATFRALGFREVARFARVQAPRARGRLRSALRLDADVWRRVGASPLLRASRGYAAHGWEFVRATAAVLRTIASVSPLRGWGSNLFGAPDVPRRIDDDTLHLTPWAGSLGSILAEGRRLAAAEGRPHVGAYIPHTPACIRAARAAGYGIVPWGSEAILCEKPVRGT